jgi:hypothetical protein
MANSISCNPAWLEGRMQFDHLNRREFITLLGGAAAGPLAARAQQAGKLPTIGFLGSSTPPAMSQWVAAFVQRLRELGWIEGRTATSVVIPIVFAAATDPGCCSSSPQRRAARR